MLTLALCASACLAYAELELASLSVGERRRLIAKPEECRVDAAAPAVVAVAVVTHAVVVAEIAAEGGAGSGLCCAESVRSTELGESCSAS